MGQDSEHDRGRTGNRTVNITGGKTVGRTGQGKGAGQGALLPPFLVSNVFTAVTCLRSSNPTLTALSHYISRHTDK